MSYAIIFYSRNGSTSIAAEYLSSLTKGKTIRLKAGRYLDRFMLGGFFSSSGRRPKLKGDPWIEAGDADSLILAFPVWAGKVHPAMNSFMDAADLQNKKVYLLAVQADPRKSAQEKVLPLLAQAVKTRGGEVLAQLTIQGAPPGRTATEEYIFSQLAEWKKILE